MESKDHMNVFRTKLADLFISHSMLEELEFEPREQDLQAKLHIEEILEDIFKNCPAHLDYCNLYARKLRNKKPFAVLDAHGKGEGEWTYQINGRWAPVQNWIDAWDGKYGTLVLSCDDEDRIRCKMPMTKKSLLLFPTGITIWGGNEEDKERRANVNFIAPKIGIIKEYEIQDYLKTLKAKF